MGEMIIDNAIITILLTAESYQIHIAFRLSSDICKILPWCLGVIGITLISKLFINSAHWVATGAVYSNPYVRAPCVKTGVKTEPSNQYPR